MSMSFHRVVGEDYSLLPSSRQQSEERFFFEYREYGRSKLFRNSGSTSPISLTSYIRTTQSSDGDIQTFDQLHTNRAGIGFHSEALPQNCKKQLSVSLFMSVFPSVRLSVRMKQFGSHWTNFCEILYLRIFFENLSRESNFH